MFATVIQAMELEAVSFGVCLAYWFICYRAINTVVDNNVGRPAHCSGVSRNSKANVIAIALCTEKSRSCTYGINNIVYNIVYQ